MNFMYSEYRRLSGVLMIACGLSALVGCNPRPVEQARKSLAPLTATNTTLVTSQVDVQGAESRDMPKQRAPADSPIPTNWMASANAKLLAVIAPLKDIPASDPRHSAMAARLWKEAWSASFADEISRPTDMKGELPKAILPVIMPDFEMLNAMLQTNAPLLRSASDYENAYTMLTLGFCAGTRGGLDFHEVLASRADAVPTRGDAIAYCAMMTYLRELGSGVAREYPCIEKLAPLARARNPIVRLLTLKAFKLAVFSARVGVGDTESGPDPRDIEGRIAVLVLFQDEPDPTILREVIENLGEYRDPAAQKALRAIFERAQRVGDSTLAAKARAALSRISP